MRSVERIDRICDRLKELWKCHPDERLGQLILNHLFNDGKDPFFREDERTNWIPSDYETWEERINKAINKNNLYKMVLEKTTYRKDYEKYLQKFGKYLFSNKGKKPKSPDWTDYIRELKDGQNIM